MNMAVKRRQQMSFIRLTKKFVLVFDFLLSNLSITHGKRQTNKAKTFNSLCTFSWISDYFSVIKYRINTPSHVWFITPWCLDIRRNTHSHMKNSFWSRAWYISRLSIKWNTPSRVWFITSWCLDIKWNTPSRLLSYLISEVTNYSLILARSFIVSVRRWRRSFKLLYEWRCRGIKRRFRKSKHERAHQEGFWQVFCRNILKIMNLSQILTLNVWESREFLVDTINSR